MSRQAPRGDVRRAMNPDVTAQLVQVRVSGPSAAVETVARRLRSGLAVARETRDYPNHREPSVRRYLDVLVGDEWPSERPSPRAEAEAAKARHDLAGELDVLVAADRVLRSRPWFPIRPGDVVAWWIESARGPEGHGETLLAVDEPNRRTEAGAPLRLISQSESARFVNTDLQDLYDLWFEAGPDRLTVIRAGRAWCTAARSPRSVRRCAHEPAPTAARSLAAPAGRANAD